ncbi:MAG TPA: hypothetical protein VGO23_02370 [Pseudonocardia sp.]|jgi:hypothetical protein|nr:hypothetical protein [Pseudonocardia sp.]
MRIPFRTAGGLRGRAARRPATVLIGVALGLGLLGGVTGTALGLVGSASSAAESGGEQHHRFPLDDPADHP